MVDRIFGTISLTGIRPDIRLFQTTVVLDRYHQSDLIMLEKKIKSLLKNPVSPVQPITPDIKLYWIYEGTFYYGLSIHTK